MMAHHHMCWLLLLSILFSFGQCFVQREEHRIYLEPSGQRCFWQGEAPFCFVGSGCPTRTMTVKKSSFGDGAYCWLGYKFYCCSTTARWQTTFIIWIFDSNDVSLNTLLLFLTRRQQLQMLDCMKSEINESHNIRYKSFTNSDFCFTIIIVPNLPSADQNKLSDNINNVY